MVLRIDALSLCCKLAHPGGLDVCSHRFNLNPVLARADAIYRFAGSQDVVHDLAGSAIDEPDAIGIGVGECYPDVTSN